MVKSQGYCPPTFRMRGIVTYIIVGTNFLSTCNTLTVVCLYHCDKMRTVKKSILKDSHLYLIGAFIMGCCHESMLHNVAPSKNQVPAHCRLKYLNKLLVNCMQSLEITKP